VAALKFILNELHYELVRKISEGGMGLVYEALQHGTGNFAKVVAIKLIREEYSSIPEFQKNFIGEARLVADLIHTNIVQTYHLGLIGGQHFMVMEFVNGVNLEQFIERHRALNRPVPIDFAVFIASRIARGLTYAHQKTDRDGHHLNIVHRDVNPKNVMLGYEGDVKLTDFGIAKAFNLMYNEEGKVVPGKDEYCSPEQASYAITDARADPSRSASCCPSCCSAGTSFGPMTGCNRGKTCSPCPFRASPIFVRTSTKNSKSSSTKSWSAIATSVIRPRLIC